MKISHVFLILLLGALPVVVYSYDSDSSEYQLGVEDAAVDIPEGVSDADMGGDDLGDNFDAADAGFGDPTDVLTEAGVPVESDQPYGDAEYASNELADAYEPVEAPEMYEVSYPDSDSDADLNSDSASDVQMISDEPMSDDESGYEPMPGGEVAAYPSLMDDDLGVAGY